MIVGSSAAVCVLVRLYMSYGLQYGVKAVYTYRCQGKRYAYMQMGSSFTHHYSC